MKHLFSILALPFNVTITLPILLMFFESRSNTGMNWIAFPWFWIGVVALIDGLFLLIWTISLIATKGQGTIAPWAPTKKLVITGPFRHVRNPMITGVLLVLIGEALIFQSVWLLAWAIFFFGLNTIYFIMKEEPDLLKRFGKPYEEYCRHVNRWIPRISPWDPDETSN